ncbi:hypothetical protein [Deinococcus sonorensis]|uniref:Uncharacterized protein n=2 Tax=Deinococcus sonorensis TaxID=309891 RepID=A0AAU7UBH0_9DEIO
MSAPDALFDLAINRAATTLRGLRTADPHAALAEWHARTRFARRVPLAEVWRCLEQRPQADGEWHWQGGPTGGWQPGRARFP